MSFGAVRLNLLRKHGLKLINPPLSLNSRPIGFWSVPLCGKCYRRPYRPPHETCNTSSIRGLCSTRGPLYSKEYSFQNVNTYGRLSLKSGGQSYVQIQPVDPLENPEQDSALVCSSEDGEFACEMKDKTLAVETPQGTSTQLDVTVPLKFDVEAVLQDSASVSVTTFENESIQVQVQQGKCHLSNIKTDRVHITSGGGDVTCDKLLQGAVTIHTTNHASVTLDRAVGTQLLVETEDGHIHIQSLYADDTRLVTARGQVSVRNSHRSTNISVLERGNVSVGSVDGSLTVEVKEGDISVNLIQPDAINICTHQGDVTLSLSPAVSCRLDLSGDDVTVTPDLSIQNSQRTSGTDGATCFTGDVEGGEDTGRPTSARPPPGQVTARAHHGNVTVRAQDWFSSLNLHGNPKSK